MTIGLEFRPDKIQPRTTLLNSKSARSTTGMIRTLFDHGLMHAGKRLSQWLLGPRLADRCLDSCNGVGMFFCPITARKCSTSAMDAKRSSTPYTLTRSRGKPLQGIAFVNPGSNLVALYHTL
jgi:hypothetical protein